MRVPPTSVAGLEAAFALCELGNQTLRAGS